MAAGPASVAEIQLYEKWLASDLPHGLWNVDLLLPDGSFLARPDVYLPEVGVVFELDSDGRATRIRIGSEPDMGLPTAQI